MNDTYHRGISHEASQDVGNHIGIHMAKKITQEELRSLRGKEELYSNRETSQPIASST